MFKVTQRPERARQESGYSEISFADVVRVLRSNFKFFGLMALGLCTIGVILTFFVPEQYERRVELSVRQLPVGLSEEVNVKADSTDELGNSAVRYVRDGDLPGVTVNPRYDRNTQQVELNLQSPNRDSLKDVGPEVIGLLKSAFQGRIEGQIGAALDARISVLGNELERREEIAARMEEQIEETPSDEPARVEGLEVQRAAAVREAATAEIETETLQEAQANLDQLASEAISVEVVDETAIRQSSSLAQKISLAVLIGVVAAALLTFARGALGKRLRRGKAGA